MARPLSIVKSFNRLYNFCARPMLISNSVAFSNKFVHQFTKPPEVTIIPPGPRNYIAPPPVSNSKWEFPRKSLLDSYKRPQPSTDLDVTPLARLTINKYESGRVFCWNHRIFFQVGGATRFQTLCDQIRTSVSKNGQSPRHFSLDEVGQLERNQMVLCSETLGEILWFREEGNDVVDNFGLPGALLRARLLQNGAIPATIRGHCEEEDWVDDRLVVELVDIGVTGYAHVEKLIPMPQSIKEIPAMAITIGLSEGLHRLEYEDKAVLYDDAGFVLEECAEYAHDAMFMPQSIHPDDEHLPAELGADSSSKPGTCVRSVDGLLKFEIPKQNVESVPEPVLKLIGRNLPFKTKVRRGRRNNCHAGFAAHVASQLGTNAARAQMQN